MDGLDSWIYIIIMAIAAFSSLVSSINKKKREQQTQMPAPTSSDGSYPVPPPIPKRKSKKPPTLVSEQTRNQPFTSFIDPSMAKSSLDTEMALMPEEETVLADELDLADANALRQAVIYAEILNRKY